MLALTLSSTVLQAQGTMAAPKGAMSAPPAMARGAMRRAPADSAKPKCTPAAPMGDGMKHPR